jgi:ABC-type Fe3+/spermidine/putrescine transport system ATPase subunit
MIAIAQVFKAFGATRVLEGVELAVQPGEIVALLGPSGCGKTTLLRAIAGLERPDRGSIRLAEQVVFQGKECGAAIDLPPEQRGVGLVFQDFALFPHLDVRANIAFGLRRAARAEREARVAELLIQFELQALGARHPGELSGGQQQRVALARALAPRPRVLLMDEPFSNLDAGLRRRLRVDLRARLKQIGVTTVFVTHDQEEALSLADRVAVMHAGRIRQCDTPERVYREPADLAVARATGQVNLVPGRAQAGVVVSALGSHAGVGPDGDVVILARPEAFRLSDAAEGVPARVIGRDYVGAEVELWLELHGSAGEPLVVRGGEAHGVAVGAEVRVELSAGARWCAAGVE